MSEQPPSRAPPAQKRRRSQGGEGPSKRFKQEGDSRELTGLAQGIMKELERWNRLLERMAKKGVYTEEFEDCLIQWETPLARTLSNLPWTTAARDALNYRLPIPDSLPNAWRNTLEDANILFSEYSTLQKEALAVAAVALPPPSDFAQKSVWHSVQEKHDHMQCLRPTKRAGLPLSTLHPVFPAFLDRVDKPIPDDSATGHAALRAASALCSSMGEPFNNENQRGKDFDTWVSDLFTWAMAAKLTVSSSRDTSKALPDRIYFLDEDQSIPVAVREDKLELGEGKSDVYLQTARSYDALVNKLRDQKTQAAMSFLKSGAPMFLLSIVGPLIFVAGGFFDGDKVIVEPLEEPKFMLQDHSGRRQRMLAQLLYALQLSMEDLSCALQAPSTADFPPAVPRLYTSITCSPRFSQNELKFQEPVTGGTITTPTFFATLLSPELRIPDRITVVVKLVPGRYGADVHRLLSDNSLAPQYYGYTTLAHAPTAHVMERLPESWISLFDFAASSSADIKWKNPIKSRLDDALVIMARNGFVHGDLRSNNIFIEVDQESKEPVVSPQGSVSLKVLDFDWAGKAGDVRYPATRNNKIRGIVWPGDSGSIIGPDHDRLLVDSWWPAYLC